MHRDMVNHSPDSPAASRGGSSPSSWRVTSAESYQRFRRPPASPPLLRRRTVDESTLQLIARLQAAVDRLKELSRRLAGG